MKDLNVTIDGKYCTLMFVFLSSHPNTINTPYSAIGREALPVLAPPYCENKAPLSTCFYKPAGIPNLPLSKDALFAVEAINGIAPSSGDTCDDIITGQTYSVFIDLTYDETIGGVTST